MNRHWRWGILGVVLATAGPAAALAADWTTWGGRPDRNMISDETGLPEHFDGGVSKAPATSQPAKLNLKWTARLGSQTWCSPVVANGRVYIGTNNNNPRDAKYPGDRSVLLCLNEADGTLLWQLVTRKPDYRELGQVSPPTVEGDRVYILTGQADMLCLDVHGLANGNDGPFTDEAEYFARSAPPPPRVRPTSQPATAPTPPPPPPPVKLGPTDADILWRFPALSTLKLYPHDATNSSPLILGNTLFVGTCNGVNSPAQRIANSTVPSFMALDKKTGKLLAVDDQNIGQRLYHGGWSSPSYGVVDGRAMIFFGGGDGWLYAFDPKLPSPPSTTQPATIPLIWKHDCIPMDMQVRDGKPIPYRFNYGPCEVIATPVFYKNRVYVPIGKDPEHGPGLGSLWCLDPRGSGDITGKATIWQNREVGRSISTVAIAGGLLYLGDQAGVVYCLDAETGKILWQEKTGSCIWSACLVADGRVYACNEKGQVYIFAAAREKKLLDKVTLDSPIYATPVAANGVLYLATKTTLYAFAKTPAP